MRGICVAVVVSVLGGAPVAGQVLPEVPAALDRLDWLVGEWEGEGWMEYVAGQRGTFRGQERVERRMGGRLVVVEGSFATEIPGAGEVPVHQAFGIFQYDPASDRFRFRTYTALGPGVGGLHDAEVGEGRVVWGYEDPRLGTVRYTLTRTEADEWLEVGDASRDGGATWRRFFEMRLARR
jgi:hypothetical protein